MTSKLVTDRLQAAGLLDILTERASGAMVARELRERLGHADTLLLGAAADIARRRELGEEATLYLPHAPAESAMVLVMRPNEGEGGTSFLRRVAETRLTAPVGLTLVVEWTALGLETAQLALSFGANALAGPIASRRGLPMADTDEQRGLVKRRELAAYVERAGYRPRFVNSSSPETQRTAPSGTESAHVS